jgi:hypothetical protein
MKRVGPMAVGASAALLWITGTHATNVHHPPSHSPRLSTTTFGLTVTGTPAKGTTFWVAHGPLAGRFGVIRLQPRGNHTYSARVTLPVYGVTTFTYLAAQGTQMVHGMPEPGGTVVVIRAMESVTATVASQRVVHWSVPLG